MKINVQCIICDKPIMRSLSRINMVGYGDCCSKVCKSILFSAIRRYTWESGIMDNAATKCSETKKLLWATGKLKSWNKGKTKETDSRIDVLAKKMSISRIGENNPFFGKRHTAANIQKYRLRASEYAKSGIFTIKPTKPEKFVIQFVQENKLPYKYTGNGKFWIESINPDFVNINGEKKAIEVNGCYWHNCPIHFPMKGHRSNLSRDKHKEVIYNKYGWSVIKIWEHDCNNDYLKNLFLKEE